VNLSWLLLQKKFDKADAALLRISQAPQLEDDERNAIWALQTRLQEIKNKVAYRLTNE
jgi:hypothetical protein